MMDRELLELVANQMAKLTKDVDEMKANMTTKDELAAIKADVKFNKDELAAIKADAKFTKNELVEIKADAKITKDELAAIKADAKFTKDELVEIKTDAKITKDELAEIKADVKFTKEAVIKIESDHGHKLGALFDGYKLNSEKLDRIETEVAKHEEVILRRIR